MRNSKYDKYMLLLSVVGALLCFYLYYTDVVKIPAICPNSGCAQVANSQYSRFLGIHVSLWGLIYYVGGAALISLKSTLSRYYKYLLTLFVACGVGFTLYLRFVELMYIKAICVWCWASVVVVVLLTVLYFLSMRVDNEEKSETTIQAD